VLVSLFCPGKRNGIRFNSNYKFRRERRTVGCARDRRASNSAPQNAIERAASQVGREDGEFGGWDMPVEYPANGGLIAEHKAVAQRRWRVDVSHMGDIRIRTGKTPGGALAAVQHLSMNDAAKLALGQAQYSAMLYPQGTFVDDVIVHRMGEDDFFVCDQRRNARKRYFLVRENTKEMDCVVEDYSDAYTQLAIQGPQAIEVMKKLTDANVAAIRIIGLRMEQFAGCRAG